jgi:hypothetical protein
MPELSLLKLLDMAAPYRASHNAGCTNDETKTALNLTNLIMSRQYTVVNSKAISPSLPGHDPMKFLGALVPYLSAGVLDKDVIQGGLL